MEVSRGGISVALVVLLISCFCSDFGAAIDTITSSQPIRDHETIISDGGAFKLGFFSPGNSTNRYMGIWYNEKSGAVVWVANRNKPLKDSSGVFTISEEGKLVVLNGQNEVLWSSDVSNSVTNASARLLDSGNLVLQDNNISGNIWESFQEPTDAFMRGMKMSTNARTGKKVQQTSWKSPSDPSTGNFSMGLDLSNIRQAFIWKNNLPYFRAGQWNGREFIGVTNVDTVYLGGFQLVEDNQEGTASLSFEFPLDPSTYFLLTWNGRSEQRDRVDGKGEWVVRYMYPNHECDIYGCCGAFGICDKTKKTFCSCLRGFEPKNMEEWNRGNWTSGCVRSTALQCESKSINKTGEANKEDGFSKMEKVKVPDFAERTYDTEDKCREFCLSNCSCIAYAYAVGIGCMQWRENLTDIQQFYSKGTDFYIRLAHSELDKDKKDRKVVITVSVVVGAMTVIICTFFLWRWMAKHKAMKERSNPLQRDGNLSSKGMSQVKIQDLTLFSFEKLATATDNFNSANKLGQGGFGPVYKGVLEDGQEIAVKRLSKASGQGLQEFMNEVMVISKLQHRNLVRLFGCCVEGEEKMLIYECMPNKSLDAFLFDVDKRKLLDWGRRFNITKGISRGLLYLHRDSRLRIIHRDLKASNILLDEELNPKISDFGMARIFGGDQDQAKTIRVVGTYGYMSPEYAMRGQFSEKSDVFSFGVLLLEIVSGRRNAGFYQDELSSSLLGYAWKLWNENNIISFIDPVISDPCSHSEILRCIHVGLLCVQELVKDRPTMSTVISMLNSEIADLPIPKQPAFTTRQNASDTDSSEKKKISVNYASISVIDGR